MVEKLSFTSISFPTPLYKEFQKWCIDNDTNVREKLRALVKELLGDEIASE